MSETERARASMIAITLQQHAESINDALIELWQANPSLDEEDKLKNEIATRIWAVIYMAQAIWSPDSLKTNEDVARVMAEVAFLDREKTEEDEVQ